MGCASRVIPSIPPLIPTSPSPGRSGGDAAWGATRDASADFVVLVEIAAADEVLEQPAALEDLAVLARQAVRLGETLQAPRQLGATEAFERRHVLHDVGIADPLADEER